ncbi:hypothetical protein KFK09_022068 [Dendrobium nobile]|uniref:Uncharacterized protein n=1 Tax=Dendrobium nobile TaxID=94219 RepID=A0A8T3ANL0_DENNO|nr:hypothetical protein KFK09_022068 [Dendrobium nobile]
MGAESIRGTSENVLVAELFLDSMEKKSCGDQRQIFDTIKKVIPCGLRSTAICFRLLRRFGFQISEGIFDDFMDGDKKKFMSSVSDDDVGLLSLYNASDMAFHGEQKMDAARSFAMEHLMVEKKQLISSGGIERDVTHALDLPLHRRMPWMEARMYIDMYELEDGMSPALLQLAKIHFNEVQSIHQKELKQVGNWWTRLNMGKTISYSRDRLMECFFYVVGIVHDPKYGFCREKLTQIGMLIATIDDIYDIYGSLEELELFTQIIDRYQHGDGFSSPGHQIKSSITSLLLNGVPINFKE